MQAQINFNSDTNTTTSNSQTTTTSATTAATTQPATTTTTSSSDNRSTGTAPTITAHIPPQILGFPLLPGAGVHVQSFPIEIRGIPRSANTTQQSTTPNVSRPAFTTANTTEPNSTVPTTVTNTSTTANGTANNTDSSFNNPNVEFFMEVTPESITIDSLETTLLGTTPPADREYDLQFTIHSYELCLFIYLLVLRGPPPEFLQSIMQMAGQIISRSGQNLTSTTPNTTSTNPTTPPATETTQSNISTNQTTGQNSQARGNTQTNPTTSTQTRSTARPHVHLSSHAMQGFDPFLPCNSHHVTPRRRLPQSRTTIPNNNAVNRPTPSHNANNTGNQLNHPIYNIVNGILNSFQNAYRQRNQQNAPAPTQSQPPPTSNVDSGASGERRATAAGLIPSFLPFLQMMVRLFLLQIDL